TGEAGLVHALDKELQIVAALVQQCGQDVLEKRLGKIGVGMQIGERDLGLDHPELGEMATGVAVLGAERRAEGIDLRECQAVRLDVELATHGQECLPTEKVLTEIGAALGSP